MVVAASFSYSSPYPIPLYPGTDSSTMSPWEREDKRKELLAIAIVLRKTRRRPES
jgi:hypothetical protein